MKLDGTWRVKQEIVDGKDTCQILENVDIQEQLFTKIPRRDLKTRERLREIFHELGACELFDLQGAFDLRAGIKLINGEIRVVSACLSLNWTAVVDKQERIRNKEKISDILVIDYLIGQQNRSQDKVEHIRALEHDNGEFSISPVDNGHAFFGINCEYEVSFCSPLDADTIDRLFFSDKIADFEQVQNSIQKLKTQKIATALKEVLDEILDKLNLTEEYKDFLIDYHNKIAFHLSRRLENLEEAFKSWWDKHHPPEVTGGSTVEPVPNQEPANAA